MLGFYKRVTPWDCTPTLVGLKIISGLFLAKGTAVGVVALQHTLRFRDFWHMFRHRTDRESELECTTQQGRERGKVKGQNHFAQGLCHERGGGESG